MADVLKYDEGIVLPNSMKELEQMKPQSVVFIFNENTIPPIACDLDYLYSRTTHKTEFPALNVEKELNLDDKGKTTSRSILPTNYYSDTSYEQVDEEGTITKEAVYLNSNTMEWSPLKEIRRLMFEYGLRHEYYKNVNGKWIDLSTIRPQLSLLNPANGIFNPIIGSSTISDLSKETSIYVKLCDNRYFSSLEWERFRVNDINDIPEVEYLVYERETNDAIVHKIKRGDGTYELENVPVNVFESAGQVYKDNIHTKDDDYAKFIIRLADYKSKTYGTGTISDNDHHKFDDLHLEFYKADGTTPFTELDNLFIICNNMIVDYVKNTEVNNGIFLPNVIKYAEIQRMSTPNKPNVYMKKERSPLQLSSRPTEVSHILEFDIPNDVSGYIYHFDIKIFKWKNVSVSHFIEPLNYESMLKTTKNESNKMFWLKTGAHFSKRVNKSKTILLCGNEIIPHALWEVDKFDKNKINFLWVNRDFDILYAEIYRKMKVYMESCGLLNDESRPKLEDYIDPNGKEYQENTPIKELFDKYIEAIKAYNETSSSALQFDVHFAPSAFEITKKQFLYQQFAIVTFDTIDETNYEVEVVENRSDVEVDKPYTNHIRNKNWSPDDILVVNGLVHNFVNVYADVFTPPTKWYLPILDNVFEGADVYKLQIKRHDIKSNFYMKLNYQELLAGPIDGYSYFTYNEDKRIYLPVGEIKEFASDYIPVTSTIYDKNAVYYTKNSDGLFVRVPATNDVFEDGVTYYTRRFNDTYYVLKK